MEENIFQLIFAAVYETEASWLLHITSQRERVALAQSSLDRSGSAQQPIDF